MRNGAPAAIRIIVRARNDADHHATGGLDPKADGIDQIFDAFPVLDVERRLQPMTPFPKMPNDMPVILSFDEQDLGRFVRAVPA